MESLCKCGFLNQRSVYYIVQHVLKNWFALVVGLFKGSVTPDPETTNYNKIERPTTLRQLKSIYTPHEYVENGHDAKSADYTVNTSPSGRNAVAASTNGTDKNVSMSILSPFDEQEEWAKISEIMASFGSSFNHESIVSELEQEFETRFGKLEKRSIELIAVVFFCCAITRG